MVNADAPGEQAHTHHNKSELTHNVIEKGVLILLCKHARFNALGSEANLETEGPNSETTLLAGVAVFEKRQTADEQTSNHAIFHNRSHCSVRAISLWTATNQRWRAERSCMSSHKGNGRWTLCTANGPRCDKSTNTADATAPTTGADWALPATSITVLLVGAGKSSRFRRLEVLWWSLGV